MSEKVRIEKVYVFTEKESGVMLRLYWGYVPNACGCDEAYENLRWMVRCTRNPLPIHSGSWFNGFNASIMIQWFQEHGFMLKYVTNLSTGMVEHYATDDVSFQVSRDPIVELIRKYLEGGHFIKAADVYMTAYSASLEDARKAINAIRDELGNSHIEEE